MSLYWTHLSHVFLAPKDFESLVGDEHLILPLSRYPKRSELCNLMADSKYEVSHLSFRISYLLPSKDTTVIPCEDRA